MRIRPETTRRGDISIITGRFLEDAGYSVSRPGGTDDFLVMLTLSGQGRIGFVGGSFVCKTGDLTLIRPRTMHDYATDRATGAWEFVWAHFVPRPHQFAYFAMWPEKAPGLIAMELQSDNGDVLTQVKDAVLEMHRRANGGLPHRSDFALNALEEALIWCDTVNPRRRQSRIDPRVSRAMAYMQEHLAEPVTLSQLADLVHLSSSRFSHLFREELGQTPQNFLETQRIERAEHLLALSGQTITAISAAVGYESPFYFTTRFKKRVGCSPGEWRVRQRHPAGEPQ